MEYRNYGFQDEVLSALSKSASRELTKYLGLEV
jgi:hypothetical protein